MPIVLLRLKSWIISWNVYVLHHLQLIFNHGVAVEHLCLAAAEQGLGTCWVCNFDAPQCSEVLGLPENLEPAVLIPVGYAEDEPTEKKRKPLNEILL